MNTTLASPSTIHLVRYGAVPEVARFRGGEEIPRGTEVVVDTHHGPLVGTVLDVVRNRGDEDGPDVESESLRIATPEDLAARGSLRSLAEAEFDDWCRRIQEWNVELDLVDLEWTLDHRTRILYVLSDRGPGATQLALKAAAAGLGVIAVQPVAADGPIPLDLGGGCGSGGCGCSH